MKEKRYGYDMRYMDGRICIFTCQKDVWRIDAYSARWNNIVNEPMLKALINNLFMDKMTAS